MPNTNEIFAYFKVILLRQFYYETLSEKSLLLQSKDVSLKNCHTL